MRFYQTEKKISQNKTIYILRGIILIGLNVLYDCFKTMAANEHNGWMRFFWILVLIRLLNDVESLLYIHPDRCQSGNYFDTLQLRCKSCADHFDVNGTEFDQSFRTDFNDRTKCLCPDSYRFMIENDRIRCRKIDCLNGQILHNGICQRCADESCLCPSGMILRRISLDEVRCESCRFGDPDCDQCDRSFYNIDAKRCHCPQSSTHIIEDGQCLDRTKILLQNLLISYSKISSLNSGTHLSKFVFDSLRPASKSQEFSFTLKFLCFFLRLSSQL